MWCCRWGRVNRKLSVSHLACTIIFNIVILLRVEASQSLSAHTSIIACKTLGTLSITVLVSVKQSEQDRVSQDQWDSNSKLAFVWREPMVYTFAQSGHSLANSVLILSSLCHSGSWFSSMASTRACKHISMVIFTQVSLKCCKTQITVVVLLITFIRNEKQFMLASNQACLSSVWRSSIRASRLARGCLTSWWWRWGAMIVLSVAGWPVYALLSCIKEFVKIKSGIMSQCFNSPLFSSLVVLSLAISESSKRPNLPRIQIEGL